MNQNMDIVFMQPQRFEDCVKCVEYIKNDILLHVNFSELDEKDSQRMIDYISGAVFIKEGKIIQIGEKFFCTIPNGKKYKLLHLNTENNTFGDDEEEEIIPFKK